VLPKLENSPQYEDVTLIWQQDGAPSHCESNIPQFLDLEFEDWIGRRENVDWPPRSCDLIPCDFSM
jgi:hypothetical protein